MTMTTISRIMKNLRYVYNQLLRQIERSEKLMIRMSNFRIHAEKIEEKIR